MHAFPRRTRLPGSREHDKSAGRRNRSDQPAVPKCDEGLSVAPDAHLYRQRRWVSVAAGSVSATTAPSPELPRAASRRPRRRPALTGALLVVVVAGLVLGITRLFDGSNRTTNNVVDNTDPTGLQTVTRQNLSSQTEVPAALGYAGTYSVVNQGQGTVTSLPAVGQVVSQGQVLHQVDGAPVVLLYGSTPAYRALSEGSLEGVPTRSPARWWSGA
jgi:hypothetical protein